MLTTVVPYLEKDEEIRKWEVWCHVAREKGFVCSLCGEVLAREELVFNRPPYLCGHCRHHRDQDLAECSIRDTKV